MANVTVQAVTDRLAAAIGNVYDKEAADIAQVYKKTEVYNKAEVDAKLTSAFHYKGNVANEAALPASDNQTGDVYNCLDTGDNYAWSGTDWDKLSGTVDLTQYAKTTEVTAAVQAETDARTTSEAELRALITGGASIDDTALAALETKIG